ncbi:MAG TPA: preprotein translocase subunit SecG [Clostridiaceae bacterium]|jgi:preprotein translocase subunit SecG|nr:preprotein translocase subunit SecG [Clostridiaceae bacterium]
MLTAVIVLHIIVCIALILVILLQSSKVEGLTGIVQGGAETFFGKNKGRSYEGKLARLTTICMIVFIITSIAIGILSNK